MYGENIGNKIKPRKADFQNGFTFYILQLMVIEYFSTQDLSLESGKI